MSQFLKPEYTQFKLHDRAILDFIEDNRKMIQKKIAIITNQLHNLEEENEQMILKFTKFFLGPKFTRDLINQQSTSTILGPSTTRTATIAKSPQTQKTTSRNEKNSKESCLLRMSQSSVMSSSNNSNYAKRCIDKSSYMKDKVNVEIDKMKKSSLSIYEKNNSNDMKTLSQVSPNKNALRNSWNGYGFGNTEMKASNRMLKSPKKIPNENNTDYDQRTIKIQNELEKENDNKCKEKAKDKDDNNKELNNKDKAILCIIKSDVFTLQEKMLFWFTNPIIQTIVTKRKIVENESHLIQAKENYYMLLALFRPSMAAQHCLSFIKPTDEEELQQLANNEDDSELSQYAGIITLLYSLLKIPTNQMTISQMIINLYSNIFKEHNVASISKFLFIIIISIEQFITKVICENINLSNSNNNQNLKNTILQIITKYPNALEASKYLRFNRALSFICYIIKELIQYIMTYDDNIYHYMIYQCMSKKLYCFLSSLKI